ncbi:hypothetical protein B0H65DRAFT_428312 [Neurospora tetraspora]|uniref:Uncharacterized protein n=1 Tax=Neurospora tetraspora TaxID=94610 RepID=A0AAE0MSB7_9PEZI|nr:hypothetical protein B0H65DRAFT_428312 [Neurospora tetraspora]
MNPFRRAPEAQGEHVSWRSNTTIIPDDVIDPELLAASNRNVVADQPTLLQQPPQLLAESSQGNNVEQTSVYQHPPLDVHQSHPQRNPFSNPRLNPQFNHQPNLHVSSPSRDGSLYQHPQLDVRQSNPFSNPHANRQIIPHFNSQPNPQPSPQGHSPPRDESVYQHQPFNPFALAYSPPQDGRTFFQQPAASHSLTSHLNPMSQGDAPASPPPGTSHLQQDSFVRANIQSPVRSRSQSFSRGFGQGPMEMDDSPFPFQAEADSSPLSSLAATPAVASATLAMDLDDWEPGREAQVGIPSSSPPRNNATPKRPRERQQEDLQGREGQYQRPRRYNIDVLLSSVSIAPVAEMEIDQGVAEGSTASAAASHVDMESTSHDPSLQRPGSQENARPRATTLEIGTALRDDILRRIRPGISFPSGVPYSTRYSEYTQPPEDFSRPLGSARPMPPPENLPSEHGRSLSDVGVNRIRNVSGPQTGESSRHGQHLNSQAPGPSTSSSAAPQVQEGYPSHESYTEGVLQHMRAATPGPSGSASTAPKNPEPALSGHSLAGLVQGALQEASVNDVVTAAHAILNQHRGSTQNQYRQILPAPTTPMEIDNRSSHQPTERLQQRDTQSDDQVQQQDMDPTEHQSHQLPFTNMEQFQPIPAPAPTIRSPLLISPFPLRIPDSFTPAILSLAIDPPRSLQIGTTDSLRSYLRACGIVPYNDLYPRTIPDVPREPFNRTVVVEARYLSVIGLLYPRAEFIVSRIAEGAEEHMEGNTNYNKKLEPNAAMMMEKWHVYKAVRMTGEEMQKLGVCVWSEKGCGEWEPVVEEARETKRVKRTEVVVVDDDEEEEEESDDTVVASGKAKEGAKNENTRPTVEEDEEADEDVEMVDVEEEVQTSKKRKGKAKEVEVANKKGKGKEVLQEKDGSGNAAAQPSASKASAPDPASAPLRRSARVQSRQGSAAAEEANSDRDESKTKLIITRKLRAIQLDEAGESSSAAAAAAANPSRPIKTPKPRLTTTKAIHSVTEPADPRAAYLREASTHYLITLRQRDWPSGGVARIQCTPKARQTIEYIQESFGIQSPYEVWRQKDYRVWNGDTGEVKRRYIKVMRGYAGDENTEDGVMRLFLDEMDRRMKEKEKRRKEKGKGKMGEEETGDGKDMSTLEERKAWKESYKALKRRGKRAVARAKGKSKEGEDIDMDFDEWLAVRREEENELCERWFKEREGLVEEEEVDSKTVEFALFEYGGGDGLGLGKA